MVRECCWTDRVVFRVSQAAFSKRLASSNVTPSVINVSRCAPAGRARAGSVDILVADACASGINCWEGVIERQDTAMRSDIVPGNVFPDYALPDHSNTVRKLSELQGRDPMVLLLSRGHF